MNGQRTGTYTEEPEGRPRRAVKVIQWKDFLLVGNRPLPGGLQLPAGTHTAASRDFVKELFKIALALDANLVKAQREVADRALEGEAVEGVMRAALRLDPAACRDRFAALRKIGVAFRYKTFLSNAALLEALRGEGVLPATSAAPTGDEPQVTFIVNNADEGARAPVLWDMMYEGNTTTPLDWRSFWGFRFPLSHFVYGSRPESIRLRTGFAASNEELKFAGRELEQSLDAAKVTLPVRQLCDALRDQARRSMLERLRDSNGVNAWWQGMAEGTWLVNFLAWLQADALLRVEEGATWKTQALVRIFTDTQNRFDVMHFACHCRPSAGSEFLSRLDMKIAGEPVPLDVAALISDLSRRTDEFREWTVMDPGPLVFLNACGTGNPGDANEPPGLPNTWIDAQGALAVVATLCPVPDFFAYAFARKFYETLFGGLGAARGSPGYRHRYVAEAFLETRRYFLEEYGNPLGLAYVLYAYPGAYALSDFLPGGGSLP